jgi:hypothetical protein
VHSSVEVLVPMHWAIGHLPSSPRWMPDNTHCCGHLSLDPVSLTGSFFFLNFFFFFAHSCFFIHPSNPLAAVRECLVPAGHRGDGEQGGPWALWALPSGSSFSR